MQFRLFLPSHCVYYVVLCSLLFSRVRKFFVLDSFACAHRFAYFFFHFFFSFYFSIFCSNIVDSLQQRTAFLISGGVHQPTTGYTTSSTTTTNQQQIQSFLIPQLQQQQQQSLSHSLFLDHLVTIVPSNVQSTTTKQLKPVSSTVLKLDDGPLTGKKKIRREKRIINELEEKTAGKWHRVAGDDVIKR